MGRRFLHRSTKPDPDAYPLGKGDAHWTARALAVSRQAVEANFERYGLLDVQVRFLEGWFKDTLQTTPLRIWRSSVSTGTCTSRR